MEPRFGFLMPKRGFETASNLFPETLSKQNTMGSKKAIINPKKGKKSPDPGELTVMAGTRIDLLVLCDELGFIRDDFKRIFNSRVYTRDGKETGYSLTGPMVGAPYAVMILEQLIAWGARKILFFGWCGAISEKVKTGDIILPTSCFIDEGTSIHYNGSSNQDIPPSSEMTRMISETMHHLDISHHQGRIWTTDAVFRETEDEVIYHQNNRVLAVEMEVSALLAASKFRNVQTAAVLVVSDELSQLKWRPGFRDEDFKNGRRQVCRLIKYLCKG